MLRVWVRVRVQSDNTGRHDCLLDHEENSDTKCKSVSDTSVTEPCVINCACYGA